MIQLSMSAHLLHTEAVARGISCHTFASKHLILMTKNGKSWFTMGSRSSLQSSVGKSIGDKKDLTKEILAHYQIPTAKYKLVSTVTDIDTLSTLQFPLVMKPLDGHQGEGVIVGISSIEEAKQSFSAQTNRVLFEEMLQGKEYRITCVDYKVVAASYRRPAYITGDGEHTISELIEEKNSDPKRGVSHDSPLTKIKVDDLVIKFLKEQSLALSSVPQKDAVVFLRKTANLSTGGEAQDVTEDICEENKNLFEQIATVCDLNIIGIDVMCTDLSSPISLQQNAGIIEVNSSPGLRMHHFPSVGKPRNVAGAILDMVEKFYG